MSRECWYRMAVHGAIGKRDHVYTRLSTAHWGSCHAHKNKTKHQKLLGSSTPCKIQVRCIVNIGDHRPALENENCLTPADINGRSLVGEIRFYGLKFVRVED